jgi:hypothetical protein
MMRKLMRGRSWTRSTSFSWWPGFVSQADPPCKYSKERLFPLDR